MTRRTVVWLPDAEAELAEVWLTSDCRNDVTTASREIDRKLGQHAKSVGIDLSEGLWRLDQTPLRVIYEIPDRELKVYIVKVKLISPR